MSTPSASPGSPSEADKILADVETGFAGLITLLKQAIGTGAKTAAAAAGSSDSTSVTGTLALDVAPMVTGGEAMVTAGEKLATVVTQAKNTPAMVSAATAQNKQNAVDALVEALKDHDEETVRRLMAALPPKL